MAISTLYRTYKFSDATLCLFTSNLCAFMTRDLAELASFGVTVAKITELKNLGNQFEIFPSNESLIGDLMIATEKKNQLITQVKTIMRDMALRVENKWGINSGQYKRLGFNGINRFNDDTILFTARSMHLKMTEYLPDLAGNGLTQAMLDDFNTANQALEASINVQSDAKANRDFKTNERIVKGNNLYKIVCSYCDIGKRVWMDVNPARYQDYVIYESNTLSVPAKIEKFRYELDQFIWNPSAKAEAYFLEKKGVNDADWNAIASIDSNTFPMTLLPGSTDYRVKGVNESGSGPWSDVLTLGNSSIQPPSRLTVKYNKIGAEAPYLTVEWLVPPEATLIRLYISETNGTYNNPEPSIYTKIYEGLASSYRHNYNTPTKNMKYFYAVALMGTEISSPSAIAWIDLNYYQ